jgi:hypothetical protein
MLLLQLVRVVRHPRDHLKGGSSAGIMNICCDTEVGRCEDVGWDKADAVHRHVADIAGRSSVLHQAKW